MNNIQPQVPTTPTHNQGEVRHRRHDATAATTRPGRPKPDQTAVDPDLSNRDRGQATTEYALVLLAAALVGVLVIGWATAGGGAAAINRLFNAVIDAVIGNI